MADEERGMFFTDPEVENAEQSFAIKARKPRDGGMPQRQCMDVTGKRRGTYFINYKPREDVGFPDSEKTITVDRLNVSYHPSRRTETQSPIEAIKLAVAEVDTPEEMRRAYSMEDDGHNPILVPLRVTLADPRADTQIAAVTVDYKMDPVLNNVVVADRATEFRYKSTIGGNVLAGERQKFDLDTALEMLREHYLFLRYPVDLIATMISYLTLERDGQNLTYDVIQSFPFDPYDTLPPRKR